MTVHSDLAGPGGTPSWLARLTEASLARRCPSRHEALAVLASGDDVLLDVVAAAARVRRAFFGNRVKLNYLVNMKSGLCGEDCSYCSQRRGSEAGVLTYNWISPQQAADEAERAAAAGAKRVCLVASGRARATVTSSAWPAPSAPSDRATPNSRYVFASAS